MKQLLFLLLLLTPLLTTCKKDPPIDYERYPNSVTCKINGKHWQASENGSWIQHNFFSFSYTLSAKAFGLTAQRVEDRTILGMWITNLKEGSHNLNFPNRARLSDKKNTSDINGRCIDYRIDTTKTNHFVVHEIDSINNVIKASFEFYLINPCGEKIRITDGWIDAKLRIF
jgi:hypothetical protein